MPKPCFVPRPPLTEAAAKALSENSVPLMPLEDACKGCTHEDSGNLEYPKRFEIDLESEMLGTVKAYGRQILVSTSKSDWIKEVTDDAKSLAGLVKASYEEKKRGVLEKLSDKLAAKLKLGTTPDAPELVPGSPYPGVYPSIVAQSSLERLALEEPPRLSILNSSFISSSHAEDRETVMVFPDFKAVHEVPTTEMGVKELVDGFLNSGLGRAGLPRPIGGLKSWPLPYYAVVLICEFAKPDSNQDRLQSQDSPVLISFPNSGSHKKRDTRCHQAAEVLVPQVTTILFATASHFLFPCPLPDLSLPLQFQQHLEANDFETDERGDDICDGPSIEEWPASERESKLEAALKDSTRRTVGLFKVSHIGGHRYAGNVIVYFPNGSAVWYGRVTPRDVGAIVETTVARGKVIPELLRGGLGLTNKSQPGGVQTW